MFKESIIEKIKSDLSNNQENVNGYINSMNNIIHNSVFEFTKEWRLLDWENLSKFEFIKTLDDSLLTDVTNRIQLLSNLLHWPAYTLGALAQQYLLLIDQ